MNHPLRSARSIGLLLFLLLFCPVLPLSAQTGNSCPFRFEPEYMGEGNCFRVILRNEDPVRRPYNLFLKIIDDSVMFAGGLAPSKVQMSTNLMLWHFRDFELLGAGVADTGYLCLVATVPAARIALTWRDRGGDVLCEDTIRLDLPRPSRSCVRIKELDVHCLYISENATAHDRAERRLAVPSEGVPIYMELYLSLINRSDGNIRSVDIAGPGCDGRATAIRTWTLHYPARPGEIFDLLLNADYPHCFEVDDEVGWKVQPFQLLYYDSARVLLCADTIVAFLNKFTCSIGSVAQPVGDSHLPLDIVGTESDEIRITFAMKEGGNVRLWLADMNGNEVLRLMEGRRLEGGEHDVTFSTGSIPSGTYLCIVQAGENRASRLVRIVR